MKEFLDLVWAMTTYRCACHGVLPHGICEHYRIPEAVCGAPDPEHCPDSLREKRPPPDPQDEGPSAGLDLAKAGKWRG